MFNLTAERKFNQACADKAAAAHFGDDADQPQCWTPMARTEITDAMVETFISDFAVSGQIENELGGWKSLAGSLHHATAQQWVANKEAVGTIIGPSFWTWAKASVSLAYNGAA